MGSWCWWRRWRRRSTVAGAATGASADMTGTLHRGAAAQAAPAATLPTEATMATTTTVASTTTTSLAAALPTTGGRRGPRGEGSPAMATEDSPATTGARATTPATTMAMGITPAMALATTQVMAMATVTTTTTTGAVVSETASVLPISSAATSAQATNAPGQTTMVDQLIWPFKLFDIDLEIYLVSILLLAKSLRCYKE